MGEGGEWGEGRSVGAGVGRLEVDVLVDGFEALPLRIL
jgi:hypothetical protein